MSMLGQMFECSAFHGPHVHMRTEKNVCLHAWRAHTLKHAVIRCSESAL